MPTTGKLFAGLVVFSALTVWLAELAWTDRRGLIIDGLIQLPPQNARFLYGGLACLSTALVIVNLSKLIAGVGDTSIQRPRRYRERSYPSLRQPEPAPGSRWSTMPLVRGTVVVFALLAGLGGAIEWGWLKVPADLSLLFSSESPPTAPSADAIYHGTAATSFGKNWVTIDGKVLQGITLANPAPGAQVAILYSDGGKNVPASSLPQGFLDDWNLTPERLKAANKP